MALAFIANHLIKTLKLSNHDITSFDIKENADLNLDLSVSSLSKKLKPHYDEIYHLAARSWAKVEDPDRWHFGSHPDFLTNSLGTQRLLTATDSNLFVFSSTANLYGNGRKFDEESPFDISSPYGYSKAIAERIISLSDRRHIIYRFGTVMGTRGRCFPNRLVWCAINNVPVKIFNNGDTYRDLIDVRDIVSALISAKNLEDGIYNISCGIEISGLELAEMVCDEARERGMNLEYKTTIFSAPGYVPHSTLDISKVLNTGAWEPRIPLKETITALFDYYEKGGIEPPRWDRT